MVNGFGRSCYKWLMGLPIKLPPPGFDELDADEKLEYVDRLYELIAGRGDGQVPDWQTAILDERLAAHDRAPGDSVQWQESIEMVRAELRKSRG